MRRLRPVLTAILLALVATPLAVQAGERLRAMTYNIRLDLASDGANAWPHRQQALIGLIDWMAPDLIGMQEVLHHQKQVIEAGLPGYRFVGGARDDGRQAGEYSPIGFRRDRYALIASGTFWLSPTPQVPGKGWDAAYPRIATWARLRDHRSGKALLMLNTHLDHMGKQAQWMGARQIRAWIATHRYRGEPVIVTGDFNVPPASPPYAEMVAGGLLADTLGISRTPHFGPPGTFNAFRIDQAADSPIDHIFVTRDIAVLRHATLTQHDAGRLPSDHYPVVADLCIGRDC